ncbi:hypothetical protein [Sphingomonas sp. SUN039]|uniref:hypothetical protein n=1 Tax=Sphingomonas sp. SUN039 TaxID=2937787 RepID=UPI0021646671|nr:hypothetical protein [Sphingomonas sp. SUN039]UVO55009.1 hypothetical protein M0209_13040 [Sphingomonas sp. SUN039]
MTDGALGLWGVIICAAFAFAIWIDWKRGEIGFGPVVRVNREKNHAAFAAVILLELVLLSALALATFSMVHG